MNGNSMVGGEGELAGRFESNGRTGEKEQDDDQKDEDTRRDDLKKRCKDNYIRNCLYALLFEIDPTASSIKFNKINTKDLMSYTMEWLDIEING